MHTDGEYEPVIKNVAFLSFGHLFYFIIENHHSSVKLYNPEYVYCYKKMKLQICVIKDQMDLHCHGYQDDETQFGSLWVFTLRLKQESHT